MVMWVTIILSIVILLIPIKDGEHKWRYIKPKVLKKGTGVPFWPRIRKRIRDISRFVFSNEVKN